MVHKNQKPSDSRPAMPWHLSVRSAALWFLTGRTIFKHLVASMSFLIILKPLPTIRRRAIGRILAWLPP